MRLRAVLVCALLSPLRGFADSHQERPRPRPRQPAVATCALRAGEALVGTYFCAQGWTGVTLRVREQRGAWLRAEFVFRHDPSGATGRYTLTGSCAPDGRVDLSPEAWIERPAGYIMVGMNGVASGDRFEGRIAHASCGAFALQRQ